MFEIKTFSYLDAPAPGIADPLLPFEQAQLYNLRALFRASSGRVRGAFFGLDIDPYQWLAPEQMELVK